MSVSPSHWLEAIESSDHTIEFDSQVAGAIAQEPDRLWSLSDVFHKLWSADADHELTDLRDSVNTLVGTGHLELVVDAGCDDQSHYTGYWADECTDPLCGDLLFQINHPKFEE